ncbi:MAG: hypothetical protein JJ891_11120 [Rhizobiaceae bacterium]|nr:hypothetical protein [Rhizobiaceae bacterium]
MYAEDSFFHLSVAGRAGLALLSAGLATVTVILFLKVSNRFGLAVKVFTALVFTWLFMWLSPQVYYLYYRILFSDLPLQTVIGQPPDIESLLRMVSFTANQNLSDHSKGLLFWLMTAAGTCSTMRNRNRTQHRKDQ